MNKNYKYRNTKTKIEDSNIVIHTMIQYPRYRYTRDEEGIQLYTMQQYTIVLSGVKVFRKLQHLDLCIGLENQPTPIKSLLNGKFHLNTILSSYLVSWIKSVYNTLDQKFKSKVLCHMELLSESDKIKYHSALDRSVSLSQILSDCFSLLQFLVFCKFISIINKPPKLFCSVRTYSVKYNRKKKQINK